MVAVCVWFVVIVESSMLLVVTIIDVDRIVRIILNDSANAYYISCYDQIMPLVIVMMVCITLSEDCCANGTIRL